MNCDEDPFRRKPENRWPGENDRRGLSEWRKIWPNGLPVTANSPKSGHRKAMEGKLLQRRRNLDMIAMDLKAIWEMSVKTSVTWTASPDNLLEFAGAL